MIEKTLQTIDKNYLLYYLLIISLFGILLVIYDKIASKHLPNARVPEKTLFLISLLGASAAMYISMKIIRHKTKHASFMIIFPIFIILHLALVTFVFLPKITN